MSARANIIGRTLRQNISISGFDTDHDVLAWSWSGLLLKARVS